MNARRKDAAHARADATLNANDSWEDYYTEVPRRTYAEVDVGMDRVLELMRDRHADMLGWRRDMAEISERGSGDMLRELARVGGDRKSTRLNSSHVAISYAVVCLKKRS